MKVTTTTARLSLIGLAVALSACSVIEESKIDYKSAKKASTLEVPPDLTQLTRDTRYTAAPDRSVSAVALAAGQQNQVPVVERAAPLKVGDVEIMRDGNKRWLVVNRPADQLWEPTREFWIDHGFNLSQEKPDLGIIETDWAENRAKLPQDIIRSTIGKLFDSLYSTSERDRFRTRLERRPDGKTEIFITHRGMEEVYSNSNKDSTVWQPRDADPELETEFLRRLMIKLGTSEEQSRALVAADKATAVQAAPSAKIATINGQPAVELEEPFDRAWHWTVPASPWKTATAPRACTTCATWHPTLIRKKRRRAGSAACSAASLRTSPASTRLPCAAAASRPRSPCSTPRASPRLRRPHSASCA